MKQLGPGERIHQARFILWPLLEEGIGGWSYNTVRYTSGGRVPEIVHEQSGRLITPGDCSSWMACELMYAVLRELTQP